MITASDATNILLAQIPCKDRGDIIQSGESHGDTTCCYCHRFGELTPISNADVETRTCLVCQGAEWPAESGRHATRATGGILTSELSKRARTSPERSADLSGVTLACVDCVNPDLAAFALDMSRRGADFEQVILLSDVRTSVLPDGIEWVELPTKLDKDGYNLFMLRELHKHVIGMHVVTIQTDGWLIRPELFNRDWLQFDYVGAPWSKERWHADKSLVGNSGCCLRSRYLLEATAVLATDELIAKHARGDIYDDVVTCYDLHDELTSRGIEFAPPYIAADFSIELPTKHGQYIGETCGYHGRRHAPTRWLESDLAAWQKRTTWRQRGGEIRLCVNPYFQNDIDRQAELDDCYISNFGNPAINKTWQITGDVVPTFGMYVEVLDSIRPVIDSDTINVFCNSDVHFDESISDLCRMGVNDFACLTRHEKDGDGWRLWEECGHRSQDAWAYRGKCRIPIERLAKIKPGTPGVDNHIAFLAMEAGYRVINPSRDVRVFHLHASSGRRAGIERERIGPPYLHVWPHSFGDEPKIEVVHDYIGPGSSAVYHPVRRPPMVEYDRNGCIIEPGGERAGDGSEGGMLFMSIDVEESNGDIWQSLQDHAGGVIQYPYGLNDGDVCLVEASLGAEYIPARRERGTTVAVFACDYHLRRERTGSDQWNIKIHHIECCLCGVDRVAVVAGDGEPDGGELARIARDVLNRNMLDTPVDLVGDWVEYSAGLRRSV